MTKKNDELIAWLKAHSGRSIYGAQCRRHPSIKDMTWRQIADATEEELRRRYTRQWLQPKCVALGIETRGRLGIPKHVPPEVQQAKGHARWMRWWQRLSSNPAALESYYASRREAYRRRRRQGLEPA